MTFEYVKFVYPSVKDRHFVWMAGGVDCRWMTSLFRFFVRQLKTQQRHPIKQTYLSTNFQLALERSLTFNYPSLVDDFSSYTNTLKTSSLLFSIAIYILLDSSLPLLSTIETKMKISLATLALCAAVQGTMAFMPLTTTPMINKITYLASMAPDNDPMVRVRELLHFILFFVGDQCRLSYFHNVCFSLSIISPFYVVLLLHTLL